MSERKKGQAIVEFALIMPILLLLLLGMMEFGRIYASYLAVVHAAREGARIAALHASDQEVIERVKQSSPLLNESSLAVEVLPPASFGERASGSTVTVTCEYALPVLIPIFHGWLGPTFTVRHQTAMRVE